VVVSELAVGLEGPWRALLLAAAIRLHPIDSSPVIGSRKPRLFADGRAMLVSDGIVAYDASEAILLTAAQQQHTRPPLKWMVEGARL